MSETATRGGLRVGRTLRAALGVMRRRWVAILVLNLIFQAGPDFGFWLFYGYRLPAWSTLPMREHAFHLAVGVVFDALLAAAMARVVFADQLQGRGLSPAATLAIGWSRIPGVIYAWALISIATIATDFAPPIPSLLADIGRALVFAASAGVFSTTISVILREDEPGWRASLRAAALTRGHWPALIGTYAAIVLAWRYVVILLYGVWRGLTAGTLDPGLSLTGGHIAFAALLDLQRAFLLTWAPVLYLALRKATEGLGEGEVEVFA